jgi:enoyl-CoA hydratase/carnithine racemase
VSLVKREDRGRVSILTLNNPPANGYSHAMHRELDAHVVALRMDRGTDVIVIRGAGERFFCAGADIGYLQSLDPDEKYAFCLHANETLLRLENTPKLVIAALNGHCVGGGLEIALACDLRIGRASPVGKPNLVGLPEVSLGVLPGTGGTQRLTRILGRAEALRWMVEGKNVSVEDARAAGLVHDVLPETGWWDAVLEYAAGFCRPHKAAEAVGLIKRAVHGGADLPLEAGLSLERELQMRLFTAPDAKEGIAAFLEKRPAVFAGWRHPAGTPPISGTPHPPAAIHAAPSPGPALSPGPAPAPAPALSPAPAPSPAPPPAPSGLTVTARPQPAEPHAMTTRTAGAHREQAPRPERTIPPEFAGFEDFADFGPEEHDFAGDPFATDSGRGHAEPRPGDAAATGIDLHRTRIPDAVLNLLPRDVVERYGVIPVRRTETTLLVAMVNPHDAAGLAAIREETGLDVQAVGAPESDIGAMIGRYYRA